MTTGGEDAAALVLRAADGEGDLARTLAYRLHLICERRGWERSAGAYNSLVVAWPELVRLAAGPSLAQQSLGL